MKLSMIALFLVLAGSPAFASDILPVQITKIESAILEPDVVMAIDWETGLKLSFSLGTYTTSVYGYTVSRDDRMPVNGIGIWVGHNEGAVSLPSQLATVYIDPEDIDDVVSSLDRFIEMAKTMKSEKKTHRRIEYGTRFGFVVRCKYHSCVIEAHPWDEPSVTCHNVGIRDIEKVRDTIAKMGQGFSPESERTKERR